MEGCIECARPGDTQVEREKSDLVQSTEYSGIQASGPGVTDAVVL